MLAIMSVGLIFTFFWGCTSHSSETCTSLG
uniref:Uncharacterized protein n=1 Tax=Anguilla anguilla TaxID=7936 RepID=A0A0E9TWH5_ANGAN